MERKSWNHRILATEHNGELYLQIHEVYYEGDKPISHTKDPKSVTGESVYEVKWTLDKMEECLEKPILWGDERFPLEYKSNK